MPAPIRRNALLALLAAFAFVPATRAARAQGTTDRHRVVLQVSDADPAKWNLALNNARNIQADLGMDNVDVEIVAYGPGLAMLKADSAVATRIASAHAQGVGVLACENTMRTVNLTRAQLLPDVKFVDAGVVHLMKRQREGWSYIRP